MAHNSLITWCILYVENIVCCSGQHINFCNNITPMKYKIYLSVNFKYLNCISQYNLDYVVVTISKSWWFVIAKFYFSLT